MKSVELKRVADALALGDDNKAKQLLGKACDCPVDFWDGCPSWEEVKASK